MVVTTRLVTLFVTLALFVTTVSAQISAIAEFDQNNVKGSITLRPVSNEPGLVKMIVKLDGLDEAAGWHIHELPVENYDCLSTGGHYNPVDRDGELTERHGIFDAVSLDTIMYDYKFDLDGVYSVIGRSIVIHNTDGARIACANIRPIDAQDKLLQEHIAVATFTGGDYPNIKGTVMFRQFEGVKLTQILVKMFRDSTYVPVNEAHNWHIHVNKPDPAVDETIVEPNTCMSTGGHFDPRNKEIDGYTCDPMTPTECYVGDLAGKHQPLALEPFVPGVGVKPIMFTDVDLNLYGADSIIGRGLTIHDGSPRIACAEIRDLEPLRVIATFPGIEGSIKFTQRTAEYDPTLMEIDLKAVGTTYGGWHVHQRPVDMTDPSVCTTGPEGTVGGHWIPIPIAETGGYEIADLAGKWGSIADLADASGNVKTSYVDRYLPVGGIYGIAGRSIALHENTVAKPVLKCGTLKIQGASRLVTAVFGQNKIAIAPNTQPAGLPVSGTILVEGAPSGKGVIFSLKLQNTGAALPQNKMHLHTTPVANGGDCASTLGHYDPTTKEVDGYACNPADPINTCYKGDLSGKHGTFDIPSSDTPQLVHTFYDPDLSLAEVRNLGVVIHSNEAGAPRIACGTVRVAEIAKMEGYVSYAQSRRDVTRPAVMTYSMRNVELEARTENHKWHVHTLKVSAETATDCSAAATGGHFDPFQALVANPGSYPTTTDENDLHYEMGDMSGKHGLSPIGARGSLFERGVENDDVIHLSGEYSIAEKTILYHVPNNGADRFACTASVENCPATYTLCQNSFQCAQKLGGISEEWTCKDVAADKKEWCETVGADCSLLCFGTKTQTEYSGSAGHCVPSEKASDPFKHGMYNTEDAPPATSPPTPAGSDGETQPPTDAPAGNPASQAASGDGEMVGGAVGAVAAIMVIGAAFVLYRRSRNFDDADGPMMKFGSLGKFGMMSRNSSGASSDMEKGNVMSPMASGSPPVPPPPMAVAAEFNPDSGDVEPRKERKHRKPGHGGHRRPKEGERRHHGDRHGDRNGQHGRRKHDHHDKHKKRGRKHLPQGAENIL